MPASEILDDGLVSAVEGWKLEATIAGTDYQLSAFQEQLHVASARSAI